MSTVSRHTPNDLNCSDCHGDQTRAALIQVFSSYSPLLAAKVAGFEKCLNRNSYGEFVGSKKCVAKSVEVGGLETPCETKPYWREDNQWTISLDAPSAQKFIPRLRMALIANFNGTLYQWMGDDWKRMVLAFRQCFFTTPKFFIP